MTFFRSKDREWRPRSSRPEYPAVGDTNGRARGRSFGEILFPDAIQRALVVRVRQIHLRVHDVLHRQARGFDDRPSHFRGHLPELSFEVRWESAAARPLRPAPRHRENRRSGCRGCRADRLHARRESPVGARHAAHGEDARTMAVQSAFAYRQPFGNFQIRSAFLPRISSRSCGV